MSSSLSSASLGYIEQVCKRKKISLSASRASSVDGGDQSVLAGFLLRALMRRVRMRSCTSKVTRPLVCQTVPQSTLRTMLLLTLCVPVVAAWAPSSRAWSALTPRELLAAELESIYHGRQEHVWTMQMATVNHCEKYFFKAGRSVFFESPYVKILRHLANSGRKN